MATTAEFDPARLESNRVVATQQLHQLIEQTTKTDGGWPTNDRFGYFLGIVGALADYLEFASKRIETLEQQVDELQA
jgi:hypothetical protein